MRKGHQTRGHLVGCRCEKDLDMSSQLKRHQILMFLWEKQKTMLHLKILDVNALNQSVAACSASISFETCLWKLSLVD